MSRFAFAILLGLLGATQVAAAYDVEILQQSGPTSNRINLAVLGDGYTSAQQQKLTTDATELIEALFSHPPYKEYRNLFNVKLVKVVSQQEGADNGTYGTSRNTVLGARFNCNGIDRLLCVDNNTVLSVARQHVPEYSFIVVLVNDPKYGGAGGSIATTSIDPMARDIITHELGHTMAKLADEYEDAYPGYPSCAADCPEPNATRRTLRNILKWNHWIPGSTPIPSPKNTGVSGVGLFEGCRYQATGHYRPTEHGCMMRQLGGTFCPVCAEAMVLSFLNRVDVIDSKSPNVSSLSTDQCSSTTLTVNTPQVDSTWQYTWFRGATQLPGNDATLTITPGMLPLGTQVITAEVWDQTALVRNDPNNLRMGTAKWTVQVNPCARLANGEACTANDHCTSGICADGVCCSSVCTGMCESCSVAGVEGTCSPVTGAPREANGCGGNACSAGQCVSDGCITDAQCANGFFCGPLGSCVARFANGSDCDIDSQCVSGVCDSGVCCDRSCVGACESCRFAGHLGTCTPFDGPPNEANACGGFVCSEGECLSGCLDDADCEDGASCAGDGTCETRRGSGAPCSRGDQCNSGFCKSGVCCESACSGLCETCNRAGSEGLCTRMTARENPFCAEDSGADVGGGFFGCVSTGVDGASLGLLAWALLRARRRRAFPFSSPFSSGRRSGQAPPTSSR